MRIQVLLPIHKTMDAACVQSLVEMQADLNNAGNITKFCFANGFNAARARVGLARYAAEDVGEGKFNADYILWLDSDHIYLKKNFDDLVKQIEEKSVPMVSGSYKMRGSEETAHGITVDGKFSHFHYKDFASIPKGELLEATVVGFGFLVMRASFLQEMWGKHKEDLFKLDAKDNGTEDVTFCGLVLKEGYKVLFDPHVRIGHMEMCIRI